MANDKADNLYGGDAIGHPRIGMMRGGLQETNERTN